MSEGTSINLPPQRHIIERPRLLKLLDETTARIILLVAPAGYGKTTLARQWAKSRPHVWYRCSAASSDAAAFASGLVGAAAKVKRGVDEPLRDYLQAGFTGHEIAMLGDVLEEALESLPAETVVVVDDEHALEDSAETERLLRRIAEHPGARVLMTSRRRPPWVQARDVLYAEIAEFDAGLLSMTLDEARALLTQTDAADIDELLALCDGWPAALALASVAAISSVPDPLPADLYDYLAREIFSSFSDATRSALTTLALAPTLSRDLATDLLGRNSRAVVAEALGSGFLTSSGDNDLGMHPLLRAFLRQQSAHAPSLRDEVSQLSSVLLHHEAWDDAFTVAEEHARTDLVVRALREATPHLLRGGRLATLIEWVRRARILVRTAPEIDLAEAEIAFRRGNFDLAETLGLRAAEGPCSDQGLKSRALLRSGQAAFFNERIPEAEARLKEARVAATSDDEKREAIWGTLTCMVYTADPRAREVIRDFEAFDDNTPEFRLRVANFGLNFAYVHGGLERAIAVGRRGIDLVQAAHDPMIRSSYSYALATALAQNARYDEAAQVVRTLLDEGRRSRLQFVVNEVQLRHAQVEIGRRHFGRAAALLDRIHREALEQGDLYRATNAIAARLRLAAVQRREVNKALLRVDTTSLHGAIQGEYYAAAALYHAASGNRADAEQQAERATAALQDASTVTLVAVTRALIPANSHASRRRHVHALIETLAETEAFDPLVCGCRIAPDLASSLLQCGFPPSLLARVLASSRDRNIAARLDLPVPLTPEAWAPSILTQRESEVLTLLAEGLSNKEIAQRLYISPSTAKVHVLHIFDKLGVRSRTEAALRLQATDE